MKNIIIITLLTLSFASYATHFIEKTLTTMTITMGSVSQYVIDGSEVPLLSSEKEIIGKNYRSCGEMGSIKSEECQRYYQTRENVIIYTKKYLVRNHVRYFLDQDEMTTLSNHRDCEQFLWDIREISISTLKNDTKLKINNKKTECSEIANAWFKIKQEGGNEDPDVITPVNTSIWDKAKNYFFGDDSSQPTDTETPLGKSN